MQRYGSVIRVKPEKLGEYVRLHAAVWPGVLKTIHECNICNYSIYLRRLPDGVHYLFSYFEYLGDDFQADMARMAADPLTQQWWDVLQALPRSLARSGRRRVVGEDGRGVSPGLMDLQPKLLAFRLLLWRLFDRVEDRDDTGKKLLQFRRIGGIGA